MIAPKGTVFLVHRPIVVKRGANSCTGTRPTTTAVCCCSVQIFLHKDLKVGTAQPVSGLDSVVVMGDAAGGGGTAAITTPLLKDAVYSIVPVHCLELQSHFAARYAV